MERMTFFPGVDQKLTDALNKRFKVAKEPGDRFSAELHGLKYSGPVRVEHGTLRWYINQSEALPQDAQRTASIKVAIAKSEGKPSKPTVTKGKGWMKTFEPFKKKNAPKKAAKTKPAAKMAAPATKNPKKAAKAKK